MSAPTGIFKAVETACKIGLERSEADPHPYHQDVLVSTAVAPMKDVALSPHPCWQLATAPWL